MRTGFCCGGWEIGPLIVLSVDYRDGSTLEHHLRLAPGENPPPVFGYQYLDCACQEPPTLCAPVQYGASGRAPLVQAVVVEVVGGGTE